MPITFTAEEAEHIKSLLPSTVLEFSNVVGIDAAITIVRSLGGLEIRIPATDGCANEDWQLLKEAVGQKAADKIRFHFKGDDPIYIPTCVRARVALRDMEIISAFDEKTRTMSVRRAVRDLALEFGISYRWVEKIVNGKSWA